MPNHVRDFLGSGWKFPPRLDARGRIELAHQEQDVEEAIQMILMTHVGERPMRPEFGSRLHTLHFQPNDPTTAGLARRYVMEALARWEPRIQVKEVLAAPDPEEPAALRIEIKYLIPSVNSERNLVFPYYVIPGEEE